MYNFKWHSPVRYAENLDHVPDFKEVVNTAIDKAKTLLDVGWRLDPGADEFYDNIGLQANVTLVEAFEPNAQTFYSRNKHPDKVKVYNTDIWTFIKDTDQHFDVCIWQGGPEHVSYADFEAFLVEADKKIDFLIIATPNGVFPQDALGGNTYEIHQTTWTEDLMRQYGFTCVQWQAGPDGRRIWGLMGYRKNPNLKST